MNEPFVFKQFSCIYIFVKESECSYYLFEPMRYQFCHFPYILSGRYKKVKLWQPTVPMSAESSEKIYPQCLKDQSFPFFKEDYYKFTFCIGFSKLLTWVTLKMTVFFLSSSLMFQIFSFRLFSNPICFNCLYTYEIDFLFVLCLLQHIAIFTVPKLSFLFFWSLGNEAPTP